MYAIDIRNLTKDYGSGKGVFDITLAVEPGEIYGYLGPNGAGKSTTMRHLMGFSRPQSGTAFVEGRDCWRQQKEIQRRVGYLPGEIAFPEDMTGSAYLRLIGRMRKMRDFSRARELCRYGSHIGLPLRPGDPLVRDERPAAVGASSGIHVHEKRGMRKENVKIIYKSAA